MTDAARVEEIIAALDRGERRVAEKVGDEWVVDEDAKQAILDYFHVRDVEPQEVGPFEFFDKIPLKSGLERAGVRVVPPGAVIRWGPFLEAGAIVMPGYVNIGAWVGSGWMIGDTWATVGSCAQIGRDCPPRGRRRHRRRARACGRAACDHRGRRVRRIEGHRRRGRR